MLTGEWRKYTHVGVAQLEANSERAQIAHSVHTRARKQKVAVQVAFLSVEPEFRLNERITLTLRLLRAERLFRSVSFIQNNTRHFCRWSVNTCSGSCVCHVCSTSLAPRSNCYTLVPICSGPAQDPAVNCGLSEHSSSTALLHPPLPPLPSPSRVAPFLLPEEISVSSMKYNLTSTPPFLHLLPPSSTFDVNANDPSFLR